MSDPHIIYAAYLTGGWALGITTLTVPRIWRNKK